MRLGLRFYNRVSPADRCLAHGAAGLPFMSWTKLPWPRPLRGLQAAGLLPNRRRCWGQGPRRCRAGLPPHQTAVPGLANLSGPARLGRRLFPSSLRGSLPPWCSGWGGEDSCGAAKASAEASTKNPNCSAAPRPRAQRAVETAAFLPDQAAWPIIYHLAATRKRRAQITIAAAR